jgi:anti-sigma B factor antagonist
MTSVTTAHLTVEEQRTQGDAVLRLVGEIDMATAGELRAAATRAIQTPAERVVLDFAGVTFCDSQGLSTLISLNRDFVAAGSTLVLSNVGDFMGRLLEITGLRAAFTVEDNSPA